MEKHFLEYSNGEMSPHMLSRRSDVDKQQHEKNIEQIQQGGQDYIKEFERKLSESGAMIELSPEQREVVKIVGDGIEDICDKYKIPIDFKSIPLYFASIEAVQNNLDDENAAAFFQPLTNMVVVGIEDGATKLQIASRMFHEFMHALSFHRTKIDVEEQDSIATAERGGMRVYGELDGDLITYFDELDEAVVESLTRHFVVKNLKDDPLFAIEFENLEDSLDGQIWGKVGEGYDVCEPYAESVRNLKNFCEDIYLSGKSGCETPQEVFDVFASSLFSGKLLQLARMIERAHYKGKFRELAERTASAH